MQDCHGPMKWKKSNMYQPKANQYVNGLIILS